MKEYIRIIDFGREMGFTRGAIHKKLKVEGLRDLCFFVSPTKGKSNKELAFAKDDLEVFRNKCAKGSRRYENEEDFLEPQQSYSYLDGWGKFYIIQTMPKFKPDRIKFGFSANVDSRMNAYRIILGNEINLVQTFDCKSIWEKAAIDCATSEKCTLVEGATELFDCNLERVIERCDRFFDLLPKKAAD